MINFKLTGSKPLTDNRDLALIGIAYLSMLITPIIRNISPKSSWLRVGATGKKIYSVRTEDMNWQPVLSFGGSPAKDLEMTLGAMALNLLVKTRPVRSLARLATWRPNGGPIVSQLPARDQITCSPFKLTANQTREKATILLRF